MTEIVSNKLNPDVLPHLAIWNWEVPVYLFLGGLAAGLLVISSMSLILRQRSNSKPTVKRAALLAPIALSAGMFFLFLDLAFKLHVWRFYTAFVWTSPMSWGSWMLVVFYPFSILQAAILYKEELRAKFGGLAFLDQAETQLSKIAVVNAHIGVGVGVYTGILLATFYARPLWSNAVLGLLFLLSGLSAAAALMLWMAPQTEKRIYSRLDMYLLSLEGFALTVFVIGGLTGDANRAQAMWSFLTGHYAPWFWSITIVGGLLLPLVLETMETLGKSKFSFFVPLLVLIGSLSLRFILVFAGQSMPTFS
ncbi:MAG: NrfD/PsrC family molybdoenzyme membrane anchor subunit [bacterium]|nr:NrfD/PsrC family molybdoenzyme membrane anchor subunit [bacterium]